MILNSPIISGSLTVTGNIITSGSITISGSIASASYASNADLLDGLDSTVFTLTSSFNAQTASFTAFSASQNSFTSSILAQTASLNSFSASVLTFTGSASTRLGALETYTSSLNNKTSSFATTGSNTFIGTQTITGSVLQSGSFTSTGTLTAQTLVVQTITSSVVYSSGSNIFGNTIANTQTFTGSVNITGSLSLNSITIPTSASLASTYLQLAGGTLTGGLTISMANYPQLILNSSNSNGPILKFQEGGVDKALIGHITQITGLQFSGNGSNAQATLDASGNLGLGVTPSAWNSNYKAINIGNAGFIYGRTVSDQFAIGTNWYRDSAGAYLYQSNGYATHYEQSSGTHVWYQAPSGTAGNAITFTQAMTLTAAGRLLIGTPTEASYLLDVNGTGRFSNNVLIEANQTSSPLFYAKQTGSSGYTALQFSGNNGTDIASFTTYAGDMYIGFNNGGNGSNGELRIKKSTGAATFSSTITGTTIYGSTAVCSPSFISSGTICSTGNTCFGGMSIINNCLGIGTATPQFKLDIQGGSLGIYHNTNYGGGASGAQIYLGDMNFAGGGYACSAPGIGAVCSPSAAGVAGDLAFYNYTGIVGCRTERMRIAGGNVGIGTVCPAYTLDIKGTLRTLSPIRISNESTYGIQITSAGGSTGNTIFADGGQGLVLGGNGATALTFSYNSTTATFAGAVSKASGTFKIDHPLESLSATHQLVHSFIEGPRVDLIYRGIVNLLSGRATINIDTASGMSEGTFVALNRETQFFINNQSGWNNIKGSLQGNILNIEAEDTNSTDTIAWMVIGERQDKHIKDTDWTDSNGKPILEPVKN